MHMYLRIKITTRNVVLYKKMNFKTNILSLKPRFQNMDIVFFLEFKKFRNVVLLNYDAASML
jgi:hypothetical protein